MTKARTLIGFLYLVLLAAGLSLLTQAGEPHVRAGVSGEPAGDLLLSEVVTHMAQVQGVSPDSLYRQAARALVEDAGDPYAELMDPLAYKDFAVSTGTAFGGIGSQVDVREGYVTLVEPHAGGPAALAGLRRGDQVVEIDGASTEEWTSAQAVKALRGPIGKTVRLRIRRDEHLLEDVIEVVRDEVRVPSVTQAYRTEDGIGIIEYRSFGQNATQELRDALSVVMSHGEVRGLVLDLRGNPGGMLGEAMKSADLFIPAGQLLAKTQSRGRFTDEEYRSHDEDSFSDLPVVALVDSRTASAAEILAGALQDHDRALVIGERSYGKGSVQSIFPLAGGHRLKITTARWFTPSGRGLDRLDGEFAAADSTDPAKTPTVYRSLGGRAVAAGPGGIQPDIEIGDSILDTRAQGLSQIHGEEDWGAVRNAIFRAVRLHVGANPDFVGDEVPSSLIDQVLRDVEDAEIALDPVNEASMRNFLSYELGYHIAHARGGDAAARRFSDRHDPQVKAALDLLRSASTTHDLLRAARR